MTVCPIVVGDWPTVGNCVWCKESKGQFHQ